MPIQERKGYDRQTEKAIYHNYRWADRRGIVRMLPDTVLFHLTRLNHMVTSCVGCGVCTDVCPSGIPVATIFRTVGAKTQAVFDYTPGLSLEDEVPLATFREDELTELGERGSHDFRLVE